MSSTPAQLAAGRHAPFGARLAVAVCASSSVVPLLLWVGGVMAFRTAAVTVAVPLLLVVIAFAIRSGRTAPGTRDAMIAGVIGGLVGTLGYDLFRVPFVLLMGLGLLEPIESYGVLLLGTESSSAWTGFAGWTYHVVNGVGFSITYALVARGRPILWGIAWALVLETGTIVSPFASSYGLITPDGVKWLPIALAYAAHVPYGIAVGWAGRDPDRLVAQAREMTERPASMAIVATLIGMLLWHRPVPGTDDLPAQVRDADLAGPVAAIIDDRFVPKWLRVAAGGCVRLFTLDTDVAPPTARTDLDVQGDLAPSTVTTICIDEPGVHRVRLGDEGFTGGFVIVDETID